MVSIFQIAQYLLHKEPQKDPARLAFYHYLKNFREIQDDPNASEKFEPAVVNRFYAHALSFSHWQQNSKALENEVQSVIKRAVLNIDSKFPSDEIRHPSQMQLVRIQSPQDFHDLISQMLARTLNKGDQVRLTFDTPDRLLAFILKSDGALVVQIFSPLMTVRHGNLEPLVNDLQIYFTPQLELDGTQTHQIDLGSFLTARFRWSNGVCSGWVIRGYTFQKLETLQRSPLTHFPKLFYAVKHIEQYFIRRESDPLYTELISLLEQASELIREGHGEGIKLGEAALKRAELALENIFTDDKVLTLLVRDIKNTLAQTAQSRPPTLESNICLDDPNLLDEFQMLKPMSL